MWTVTSCYRCHTLCPHAQATEQAGCSSFISVAVKVIRIRKRVYSLYNSGKVKSELQPRAEKCVLLVWVTVFSLILPLSA